MTGPRPRHGCRADFSAKLRSLADFEAYNGGHFVSEDPQTAYSFNPAVFIDLAVANLE